MNEQWKTAAAEADMAKAEALEHAAHVVTGVEEILDAVEMPIVRNTVAVLERARERHEAAAKLAAA